MPTPPLPDAVLRQTYEIWLECGKVYADAARKLDLDMKTVHRRIDQAHSRLGVDIDRSDSLMAGYGKRKREPEFVLTPIPDDDIPVEQLVEIRKKQFAKKRAHEEARKLIPVKVKMDGPIGILHFGDPHVDDDGTDLAALEHHKKLCMTVEGLFGANVGDVSNNWVGRLARLYAEQSTSAKQAWKLVEWLLKDLKLLYLIGGNHDCLDMETEALTMRGWKKYPDIQLDDVVLSRDEEGRAIWSPILSKFDRPNTDRMVSVESRTVSFLGTAGHRMLLSQRTAGGFGEYHYAKADELPARFRLSVAAVSGLPEVDIDDEWIELAGWLLTDGSIQWTGNCPRVSFWQSKPKGMARIRELLRKVCLTHTEIVRDRSITHVCGRELVAPPLPQGEFRLNAEASRTLLTALGMRTKTIPKWLYEVSDRQVGVFLNGVVAGDGAWENADKSCAVVHGKTAFLDALQALVVSHGWRAFLSEAAGRGDIRLNLCKTTEWEAERGSVVKDGPPTDRVWCLNVPLTNFMIRRNGKPHFTGNCWSGAADPLKWITAQSGSLYQSSEVRMGLNFPNGRQVRINARHDFGGSSQWNPAHGPMKAVFHGVRDHIAICGHKHKSGYGIIKDPDSGIACHAIQVASYKLYDRYARDKGFRDQTLGPCAVTVIDPALPNEHPDLVKVFWDADEGVDYLKWKRRRK